MIKEGLTFDKTRASHGLVEIINCSSVLPLTEINLKKAVRNNIEKKKLKNIVIYKISIKLLLIIFKDTISFIIQFYIVPVVC